MTNLRNTVVLMLLSAGLWPNAAAQTAGANLGKPQAVLSLTRANNGQRVIANLGQTIQVDVQSLGSAEYESPQVSSPGVRYLNSVQAMPPSPGGAIPIFVFEAVSAGEAEIRIPRHDSPGFAVTVEVQPGVDNDFGIQLDQSSTDDSRAGWTNLVNHAVQTFTPSLPKLVKVEVELVEGNSTPDHAVAVTLLNTEGQPMAIAEKALFSGEPGWVPFLFANGGVDVTPGEVYAIEVSGGTRFGWKYAEGGYGKGEALFNGTPILKGAHASFLFKTFGTKLDSPAPLEPRP
jgi:hypothetical protein